MCAGRAGCIVVHGEYLLQSLMILESSLATGITAGEAMSSIGPQKYKQEHNTDHKQQTKRRTPPRLGARLVWPPPATPTTVSSDPPVGFFTARAAETIHSASNSLLQAAFLRSTSRKPIDLENCRRCSLQDQASSKSTLCIIFHPFLHPPTCAWRFCF